MQLKEGVEEAETRYEAASETKEKKKKELECLAIREQGGYCGLLDRLPKAPDRQALNDKVKELNEGLGDFAENAINLLTSILLKSLAIPLLFFFLLLKLVRVNWGRSS